MLKKTGMTTLVGLLSATVACSSSADDSGDQDVSHPASYPPRPVHSDILGEVHEDGQCDPSVIDIDHAKNTADIHYNGHPGDSITVEIMKYDGSSELESFELGEATTSWQIPTATYNGDIDTIHVEASAGQGKPGTCEISVH